VFNTRGLTSLACAGGAVLVFLFCFMRIRNAKAGRDKPTVLLLTKTDMQVGGKTFRLDDIAELFFVDPQGKPTARSMVFVGGSGVGGGLATGASAGLGTAIAILDSAAAAQAARSLSLAIRKRSSSTPDTICQHLTAETGEALLTDISEMIRAS
jgi:hypothetical protein